jgi:hypothetical protein
MNRYFIGLATILLSTILWAQAPNKMSFQTIVRNTQGKLVVNQVFYRVVILELLSMKKHIKKQVIRTEY